jgi:hypothetical protein
MTGQEKLEVQGRFTKKGVFKASVTNVVWALQNWSAKHGLISPGDYSARAKKLIVQTIYDEVQWHVNNAKERGLRCVIGWYAPDQMITYEPCAPRRAAAQCLAR